MCLCVYQSPSHSVAHLYAFWGVSFEQVINLKEFSLHILSFMISSFILYLRNLCLFQSHEDIIFYFLPKALSFCFSTFQSKNLSGTDFCLWLEKDLFLSLYVAINFLSGVTFWKDHLLPLGIVVMPLSSLGNYMWDYF